MTQHVVGISCAFGLQRCSRPSISDLCRSNVPGDCARGACELFVTSCWSLCTGLLSKLECCWIRGNLITGFCGQSDIPCAKLEAGTRRNSLSHESFQKGAYCKCDICMYFPEFSVISFCIAFLLQVRTARSDLLTGRCNAEYCLSWIPGHMSKKDSDII
jgi:hypothetical protein